ncbi:MAG: DUF1598 domain-containing protein, partial [Planctomycetaceae bacterium]
MRPIRFGRLFFGLAVAGLFVVPLLTGCSRQPATQAATPSSAAETPRAPAAAAEPAATVEAPAVTTTPADTKPATSTPEIASPEQQAEAHLAAGEFSAAVEAADAVEAPAAREELLEEIAETAADAGEYQAAGLIVSRFPQEARRQAFADRIAGSDLAGGGPQPDFSQLMDLIQNTTKPWFDVDGAGGTMRPYNTGVFVNPIGLMALLSQPEQSARLRDLAFEARVADLNKDMANASDLRVVSLTRLERAVAEKLRAGEPVPTSMGYLAGLTRVQYVFLDEATGEILLAGPAEGWKYDATGAAIGVESGKPVLHLDDLVTVLRTFGPGGLDAFQCLIVPRPEGLKAVQDYAASSVARGPLRAGGAKNFAETLGEKLGEQDVVVNGVPQGSRVARVIVEADYRMKLIGIDKLQGADLPSFFDLLSVDPSSGPVATKALRWWMTMNYEAVLHSGDKTAFEFVGQAVKCLSEDEFLTAEGERVPTGKAEATNKLFAEKFTAGYEQLATEDLVFAELRNVFDLSLAAAIIRAEKLDERTNWDRGVFAAGGAYEPARYAPARAVETAVNHRVYDGSEVVVQVAGGVNAEMMNLIRDTSIYRAAVRTGQAVAAVQAAAAPESRWWWDVK